MTQGYEANGSGKFLENIVEREFAARGFTIKQFKEDGDNLDMFSGKTLIKRVPYRSIYYDYDPSARESHTEFVADDFGRRIRIECKWQDSTGSTDEKFPFLLKNVVERMPEIEALILLGGDGARLGSIGWLKAEAAKIQSKKIWVVDINGFRRWIREEIVRPEAAE